MQLHTTITSPYARKVWVVAHETGLISQIRSIPTNPHCDEYLRPDNPLCLVPTLLLENGEALFDSPVICEYLDSLHDGPRLFPASGPERWRALRLQAVGDGLLDANVARRTESLRPSAGRSPSWIERQTKAVDAACQWLESRIEALETTPITIGHITVGCALGYFAVRFPDDDWWQRCPTLADWHNRFERRLSMHATRYATLRQTLGTDMMKEGPADHEGFR
jgi:glutathione S-transferase